MSSVQRRSLVRDLFVSAALRFRTLRRSLRVPDLLLDEDEGAGHGRPRGPDERVRELAAGHGHLFDATREILQHSHGLASGEWSQAMSLSSSFCKGLHDDREGLGESLAIRLGHGEAHARRTSGSHSFFVRRAASAARCASTLTPRTFVSIFRRLCITMPYGPCSDLGPSDGARIAPIRIPARPGPLLKE